MTEPRLALCTTTIHEPHVLELLHAHDPDIAIFVAGDLKTPEQKCADIVNKCGANAHYLSVETQKSLGYACSEVIGWNCIQRRNIAILEAVKFGADIIVTHDDDNLPMNESYFDDFVSALHHPFNGLKAGVTNCWFDGACSLLSGGLWHRGFPHEKRNNDGFLKSVTGAKVGVAAGLCLGDPDIDATLRIERFPQCHTVSQLADAGIVVGAPNRTVFNSQNTAFIREFAPAAFLMPGVGRYDDIWMSLIMQRVMRERNYHVHFGRPYAWQSRNPHNLMRDLKDEMFGMEHTTEFADVLDGVKLWGMGATDTVTADVQQLVDELANLKWMPSQAINAYHRWLDDIEKII